MISDRTPDDDDMLAAEYALGLLDGDELAQARRRAAEDPDFARRVTDWEIRLASLTDEIAAVEPGRSVKRDLIARVSPKQEPRPEPRRFWRKLWVWQVASAVSALLLAAVVLTDLSRLGRPAGPLYSAEIVSQTGDFRVVAVVDKSSNEVIMTRTAGAAPEGRILQVWAHGPGEPAASVGLWPAGETVRLPMPPDIAAVEGVLTLGVSEEPPGGSPTGSPSGRVFGTVDIPGVSSAF